MAAMMVTIKNLIPTTINKIYIWCFTYLNVTIHVFHHYNLATILSFTVLELNWLTER